MCGIVGILGEGDKAQELLGSLKRLEYRGYDSSGIAAVTDGRIDVHKKKGKIDRLQAEVGRRQICCNVGIAHTRWATHGHPSDINAHPHQSCDGRIAIVHNGIIENYALLKEALKEKGHRFASETDSEVIAHLIEDAYNGDILKALLKAIKQLRGSFAILAVSADEPDRIVGARKGSPLALGISNEKKILASDITPIIEYTPNVLFMDDGTVIDIKEDDVSYMDFNASPMPLDVKQINWSIEQAEKGGFPHFMLKEIHEQPAVLTNLYALYARDGSDCGAVSRFIASKDRIYIVACGTAYHSGLVGKYIFEELCGKACEIDVASEWRYREFAAEKNSVCIAISQSGETADTIAAVESFKEKGVPIVSLCNVVGSSLTRISDYVILTHAGPEISVASTKAYTAQLFCLYLLAAFMAPQNVRAALLDELKEIPVRIESVLKGVDSIKAVAKRHHSFGSFLYLGRNVDYPTALEGALKLKEISYIPAEGYPAGEMKHGPIALIDEYRAVIAIAANERLKEKMISNLQEISARRGRLVVLINEGFAEDLPVTNEFIKVPDCMDIAYPLVSIVPLQLFAYYVALYRGSDIDQPRNLAKSVTVE